VVIVNGRNEARILDLRNGDVGTSVLQLPDPVTEIAFSHNNARVLFKAGAWIHRALLSPDGLYWTDAIRSPMSLNGSRMAFDPGDRVESGATGPHDGGDSDRVLVLTRDSGFARIAELHFAYDEGPALFGNRRSLVAEWSRRIRGETPIGFVREGF